MRRLTKHMKQNKKIGVEMVRDDNANVIINRDEAVKFLGQSWGGKFARKQIDEARLRRFDGM